MEAPQFDPSRPCRVLSPREVEVLRRAGTELAYGDGELIFRAGSTGSSMFLVLAGAIRLDLGGEREPKLLEPGALFGELSLLFGAHRRTATTAAVGETVLCRLGQGGFDRLLRRDPVLLIGILRASCASLLASEHQLVLELRKRNRELGAALERLQSTEDKLGHAVLSAQTDELTGLHNRRFLKSRVSRLLASGEAGESSLGLLVLDVDDFKAINDTYGHAVGDRTLRRLAELLRGLVHPEELACRIGGDEFAVLFRADSEVAAGDRSGIFLAVVGTYAVRCRGGAVEVTVSLGGVTARAGEKWKEVFGRADANLYAAKQAGRGRLCWNRSLAGSSGAALFRSS